VTDLLTELLVHARAFSWLEMLAVLLAIAYLILAIQQSIWCWLCAALSTACYIYIFIDAKLYMESFLNLFYLGMAVYGWRTWTRGGSNHRELPVCVWPWRTHAVAIVTIVGLSAFSGLMLRRHTDAALPFVDSLTTFAAIWTTFLVARKVLENWWYWLVIDAASVVIYWSRDLPLTALLFVIYVLLIPAGLYRWSKSLRVQAAI
jgi:nicotinamide mononucleotide transporter